MITLGQAETDNINRMITISNYFNSYLLYYLANGAYEIWSLQTTDNINRDHIKRLPL